MEYQLIYNLEYHNVTKTSDRKASTSSDNGA